MALIAALACLTPPTPARAQGAPSGFEVTQHDANIVEIRFHNMPLKGVHADSAQNALALDFVNGVDGAAFDRLAQSVPDFISLAYANYDSGVIRGSRPVTFLTRNESDGFSLRMVAAGPPAAMVAAPPGPVALRGPVPGGPPPGNYPPPPNGYPQGGYPQGAPPPPAPSLFARYDSYAALRSYDQMEVAVNRDNDFWDRAYGRAAMQSDSGAGFSSEYHAYHSGDQVIRSHARVKLTLTNGVSIVGSVDDSDISADQVREPDGSFFANYHTNLPGGALGLGWDVYPDTAVTLQAEEGNSITGVRFTGYTGNPNSFWQMDLSYHKPDLDTPDAIPARGFKDQIVLGTVQHLGWGFWASLAGHGANYGEHGNASVGKTAGWDMNLRWSADLGPVLAGLSYDGHGDYLVDNITLTGAAPTPYVPFGLRNLETHAVTGTLSSLIWGDTLWLDLYGGYIVDRYASDGAIFGGGIRYRPVPGLDIALGARHSNVSWMQGETGAETSAGLSITLGFDGPALDYF